MMKCSTVNPPTNTCTTHLCLQDVCTKVPTVWMKFGEWLWYDLRKDGLSFGCSVDVDLVANLDFRICMKLCVTVRCINLDILEGQFHLSETGQLLVTLLSEATYFSSFSQAVICTLVTRYTFNTVSHLSCMMDPFASKVGTLIVQSLICPVNKRSSFVNMSYWGSVFS